MEEEEIMEKVKNFLEQKAELDKQSCYFITKKLNEEYWSEIDEEISDEQDQIDDGFDEDLEDEPLVPPQPKAKAKIKVKRPVIKINKPEVETPVQEDF